jgi:ATP-dependent RNA helicase RhlE
MKFEKYTKLSPEIKNNLNDIGFNKTTDIQFKAISAIMNGEDVLAVAQTGTGKTGAFLIPLINKVHQQKINRCEFGITCLILVPVRELAKQIESVCLQLSQNTAVKSLAIYGGVEQESQIDTLVRGVDILIATPGRMFDLINQKYIDVQDVKVLVLDEADRMLDLGFIEDIISIKRKLKERHQTLFFSATFSLKIKKLAYSQIKSSALRIQISPHKLVSKNISHYIAKIPMDDKRHFLVNFFCDLPHTKTLVFVRTKVRADRVCKHLEKNSIESTVIHGSMPQEDREASIESFRIKEFGVLIATDVNARGIDLPGITHVINYDLPDDPENYIHRIGRTGRGFAKGEAISFCSAEESEKLASIEELIQMSIPELIIDHHSMKEDPLNNSESMSLEELLAVADDVFDSSKKTKKKKKKKKKKN